MLILTTKINHANTIDGVLILSCEQRRKNRLRTKLTSGEEVAIFNIQGNILRHGDLFLAEDGRIIEVRAALESTYRIESDSVLHLLRCAFHLGNRHTQAQIGIVNENLFLRIQADNVLKNMLQKLGACIVEETVAFEPEIGAYNNTLNNLY